jgi:preprotein translocase subunit SecG
VISCFFLIFVVLIQKGEGGGLGGLAGGGVDTAFGAKADTTWKKATAVAAGLFMVLTLVLGILPKYRARSVTHVLKETPNPPAVPNSGSTPGSTPGP